MGTASSMTRPTSTPLSTMSGNFDFPPASSSSSSTSAASIDNGSLPRPLLQLRQALQRDRERDRAARESAAIDRQNIHVEVPMPPRRHRGDLRRHRPTAGGRDSRDRNTSARLPLPVPASSGYRPRATPGDRFQNLRRHRLQREQTTNDMAAINEASNRLAELDSDLTSLLMPGSISLSGPSRRTPPGELDGPRRRVKRRKLEHENVTQNFEGFKYGHFGQVVPGRLKMEMVSCDGGEYSEDSALALYRPENVLKNDKSVYCTKNSRCNILLKHQGETTFCLEKVVIKAPERGFTAPVQEGMIFVSMFSEDLITGTSGYKIEYSSQSPCHSNSSPISHEEEQLSLTESLTDPDVWAASRLGREEALQEEIERIEMQNRALHFARMIQARRRVHDMYMLEQPGREAPSSTNANANVSENCDWPLTEPNPPAVGVSAPTPPPFTITTESNGESSGEDEQPSAAIMADRLRRDSRWRPGSDDEEEDLMGMNAFWDARNEPRSGGAGYRRAARRSSPSRIEPKDSSPEAEGLITPNARFFIAKHKNKITVKFDPPVSGKYVLLKLWSPLHDGNIDIESVLFHGFSGPRYFPACQMR